MATNHPVDYYRVASLLNEEEKQFQHAVGRFVDQECMPVIAEHYDKGTFPMALIPRMAEMGLFGVHVEGYGCRKSSHLAYGLACQELGRGDSGIRAMFSVQNSLAMYPIYAFGSEEQRRKWLPRMARGEAIGCFALSEPDFGSNPAGMATNAETTRGGYVLNGRKMWITNGTIAHVAVVWAKLNGEIKGFLVEAGSPGFTANPIQRKFSYRTSPTALLSFKECFIAGDNMLPHTLGIKSVFQCLNHARYGVACGAVGAAIDCYETARIFAQRREVFDKPIASFQLVQEKLVNMLVEITKAQLINYQLGRLLDQGQATPQQISLAKMNNVREAMKIARSARDILGGRGILADHRVIRHLCDLEAVSTLEGTDSVHLLTLGKDITGISAFFG
ncbi:MAG: acyl-CoA dehydrogenase [Desulfobacteraceae bacterium]|nr:MAG: acyl-CoA dehydrogenase [Desulfobacteraceae bacterium]